MKTQIFKPDLHNIKICSKLLKESQIVGVPTETVYGLSANAYDDFAIDEIFKAKGRPIDNPLIVHIGNIDMLYQLVSDVCITRKRLIEKFWPGALTIIFKKSDMVSKKITAGLDTVAIRFPNNPIILNLINESNLPLAAPSANKSGKPSPTKASHVFDDFNGIIPGILDGGECQIGVESTVVNVKCNKIEILRPGNVTLNMLKESFLDLNIEESYLKKFKTIDKIVSPGLKYKHYSPNANVVILRGELDKFKKYLSYKNNKTDCALVFDEDEEHMNFPCIPYGPKDDSIIQAKFLFSCLREIDKRNIQNLYVRYPCEKNIGEAVLNRLIKASDFEVIDLV